MYKQNKKLSLSGIANVLALVISLITLGYAYWSQTYAIEISFESQIQSVSDASLGENTEIFFNGRKVTSLHSSEFVLKNKGSQMIDDTMIISHPLINVHDTNVLAVETLKVHPKELSIEFVVLDRSLIQVNFDLLNSGEYIKFKLITEGPIENLTVSSRIKNIQQIDLQGLNQKRSISEYITLYLVSLTYLAYFFFLVVRGFTRNHAAPIRFFSRKILKISTETEKAEFLIFLSSECPLAIKSDFLDDAIEQTKATNFRSARQVESLRDSLYFKATRKDWSITVAIFLFLSATLVFVQLAYLGYQFLLWLYQYF